MTIRSLLRVALLTALVAGLLSVFAWMAMPANGATPRPAAPVPGSHLVTPRSVVAPAGPIVILPSHGVPVPTPPVR